MKSQLKEDPSSLRPNAMCAKLEPQWSPSHVRFPFQSKHRISQEKAESFKIWAKVMAQKHIPFFGQSHFMTEHKVKKRSTKAPWFHYSPNFCSVLLTFSFPPPFSLLSHFLIVVALTSSFLSWFSWRNPQIQPDNNKVLSPPMEAKLLNRTFYNSPGLNLAAHSSTPISYLPGKLRFGPPRSLSLRVSTATPIR